MLSSHGFFIPVPLLAAITIVLLAIAPHAIAYRWTVIEEDVRSPCNQQTCAGRPHSACLPAHATLTGADNQSTACGRFRQFKLMSMSKRRIQNIVSGHNGLRNRKARSDRAPASNMNVLHWDKDLQRMAYGWLARCEPNEREECTFIYKPELTVNQNIAFLDGVSEKDWEIQIIRKWYLEGNALEAEDKDELMQKWRPTPQGNYTQLMWAASQFIGCAAARVNNRYYVMTCNYSPAGNVVGEPVFEFGTPCTNCAVDRASCSRVYLGLCGLDVNVKKTIETSYTYVAYVMLAAGVVWFVGTLWVLHKLAANI